MPESSLAEAQLLEQRDEFDIAVKTLESIIGRPLRSALPGALRDGFHPKPLVHNDFQYWLTMAVKHNAQLQRLDETLTVAKYDIERQRAGHFPRMSLVANRRNSHSENESNCKQRYDTGTLGIQVSVPLFSGGAVAAATRQAQAQYQRTAWEKRGRPTLLPWRCASILLYSRACQPESPPTNRLRMRRVC
ncbi:TolC family protein [Apirhabdus apintestini]|nr:TolC family protein [Enterobacteriaceae bacterium CA-0114]